MRSSLLSQVIDRLVANTRAIRGAPEAIVLVMIVGTGISGFGSCITASALLISMVG
jgi:hypothetical protein